MGMLSLLLYMTAIIVSPAGVVSIEEAMGPIGPSIRSNTPTQDKWAKNLYIAGVAYGRTVA